MKKVVLFVSMFFVTAISILGQKLVFTKVEREWVIDGTLWQPKVSFYVRNTTKNDINMFYKIYFISDEDAVDLELIKDLNFPAGKVLGPIEYYGKLQYTTRRYFPKLSKEWTYELLTSTNYFRNYKKISEGTIPSPVDH